MPLHAKRPRFRPGVLSCMLVWAALSLAVACTPGDMPADSAAPETLRIALFNIKELNLEKLTLLDATGRGHDPQLVAAAELIAQIRPDILVIQEIDRPGDDEAGKQPARLFLESYIQQFWQDTPLVHLFAGPSNTGRLSGLDLNSDGHTASIDDEGTREHGDDSFGFGTYPGQYSMAVYSRLAFDTAEIRTFQNLLWAEIPDHHLPSDYYPADVAEALRLSSKSHWDLPVLVGQSRLHLWISHPTPPVFDGDEDRNGRRNFDEIKLWKLYADGHSLTDDQGREAAFDAPSFVVVGDLNARPNEEPTYEGRTAISQLLEHPRITDSGPWTVSEGGRAGRAAGPPDYWERATTGFGSGSRIDYVLPSNDVTILQGGVVWPDASSDPHGAERSEQASDHRLVWLDLEVPAPPF